MGTCNITRAKSPEESLVMSLKSGSGEFQQKVETEQQMPEDCTIAEENIDENMLLDEPDILKKYEFGKQEKRIALLTGIQEVYRLQDFQANWNYLDVFLKMYTSSNMKDQNQVSLNGFHIVQIDEEACYEGQFVNGQAEGFGKLTYANGNCYIGDWKGNLRDGYGQEFIQGVYQYQGYFRNGVKEGKGNIKYQDGSTYEGDFENNYIQGEGIFIDQNGVKYSGQWVCNKQHGHGEIYWPNQQHYIGEFKEGKKNGYGEFVWKNKHSYKGMWKDGVQHGEGLIQKDGRVKKVVYKEGKKEIGASSSLLKSSSTQKGIPSAIQIKHF